MQIIVWAFIVFANTKIVSATTLLVAVKSRVCGPEFCGDCGHIRSLSRPALSRQ
jgi:hypothetical protein